MYIYTNMYKYSNTYTHPPPLSFFFSLFPSLYLSLFLFPSHDLIIQCP